MTPSHQVNRHCWSFLGRADELFYDAGVGESLQSPYCLARDGVRRFGDYSVDIADHKLKYCLKYLNPMYHYRVRAVFYQEGGGSWYERVALKDSAIRELVLESGKAETVQFDIPRRLYGKSKVQFSVTSTKAGSAVLADLKVYQYEQFGGRDGDASGGQSAGVTAPAGVPTLFAGKPNPFAHVTEIAYELPAASCISLRLFDLTGRSVRTLAGPLAGAQAIGRHSLRWDGRDDRGKALPRGIYFSRLDVGDHHLTGKLILAR